MKGNLAQTLQYEDSKSSENGGFGCGGNRCYGMKDF